MFIDKGVVNEIKLIENKRASIITRCEIIKKCCFVWRGSVWLGVVRCGLTWLGLAWLGLALCVGMQIMQI